MAMNVFPRSSMRNGISSKYFRKKLMFRKASYSSPPKKALEYKHGKHFDCMTMDKDVVAADTSFRTYYY